ncbi:MAG: hypothetical protein U1A24_11275 [Cypionkella sp.]|uniref:hypothetical protein n=1 Tax=Cypionkella sp. TaxID=2811411 RepID=UPI002AB9DA61|nr:hypothetical protein [Cypionkella sp.]MDZ4311123.1 hypothetical protein [Cypionkella sp.]
MLKQACAISTILLGALFVTPLSAGPIVDMATEIEAQIADNDSTAALDSAGALLGTVWDNGSDIIIRDAALVDAPVTMLGIYNPRQDDKYQIGAPILIYAEPVGYGFGSGGEGLHSFGFIVDLKVMTEAGEMLGELPSVAMLDVTSRSQNREFPANLTYTLTGLAPGRYILETTLRDKNSQKAGTFRNSIEIVADPAATPDQAPANAAQPEVSEAPTVTEEKVE